MSDNSDGCHNQTKSEKYFLLLMGHIYLIFLEIIRTLLRRSKKDYLMRRIHFGLIFSRTDSTRIIVITED